MWKMAAWYLDTPVDSMRSELSSLVSDVDKMVKDMGADKSASEAGAGSDSAPVTASATATVTTDVLSKDLVTAADTTQRLNNATPDKEVKPITSVRPKVFSAKSRYPSIR